LAIENDCFIISDDIFADYVLEPTKRTKYKCIASLGNQEIRNRTSVILSASKCYNMSGI
jgi:bifunctional pyridoxal-dependent enzyme with beta-cystathionase and maltose regulon repressor activities